MSTKLNLASRPFSNHALPWVLTALIVTFSLLALVLIIRWTGQAKSQAAVVQIDINALNQQEQGLKAKALQDALWARKIRVRAQSDARGVRLSAHMYVMPSDIDAVLDVVRKAT